jgi:hypothetical protein
LTESGCYKSSEFRVLLRVVFWSVSTVFQRGKGLPFGWLGLLGFAEAYAKTFIFFIIFRSIMPRAEQMEQSL